MIHLFLLFILFFSNIFISFFPRRFFQEKKGNISKEGIILSNHIFLLYIPKNVTRSVWSAIPALVSNGFNMNVCVVLSIEISPLEIINIAQGNTFNY